MKFVGILVEGQAEDSFVQTVLNPYLIPKSIFLNTTIVKTKRTNEGSFKGGISSYGKIEKDLKLLFQNTGNIATTTMFDLYGLPNDFPHRQSTAAKTKQGTELALYLEGQWFNQFPKQANFIPYLAVHEFEALLFSQPQMIAQSIPALEKKIAGELQKIRDNYENPEAINLIKAPSKRIFELIPAYRKLANGIDIANKIGISKIREECPHFDKWLTKLENLAAT